MAFSLKIRDHISDPSRKKHYNRELFREVAPKYDFVTRALSLGRDAAWKRSLVAALPDVPAPTCLDLACGTGDLTFLLAEKYPGGSIIGLDLTPDMVELARRRAGERAIDFRVGDMGKTGLAGASVHIVTGGYALRNAPDLPQTLAEIHRVLKPGGCAAFLDFSKPRNRFFQSLELFILKLWGGIWGLLLHRSAEVYAYIAASLARYPDRVALRELLGASGFDQVSGRTFFFGVVEIIRIVKPQNPRKDTEI